MRQSLVFLFSAIIVIIAASCSEGGSSSNDSDSTAVWGLTPTASTGETSFKDVAVDASGNVYVAGTISGTDSFSFGTESVSGVSSTNALLVKYDRYGTALWAKTVESGSSTSSFDGIAVDSSGNVYVVGAITGNASFSFGNSVTATGAVSGANSVIIVKYDTSGTAQWANSVSGSSYSYFHKVTVDSSGRVWAVGYVDGPTTVGTTSTFDFGNSQTIAASIVYANTVIVQYAGDTGKAQWAKTVVSTQSSDDRYCDFTAVATDGSGNAYVAGYVTGNVTYTFGDYSISGLVSGRSSKSLVLVAYDVDGTAQWAETMSTGSSQSQLDWVLYNSGYLYAGGYIAGNSEFTLGSSSVTGGCSGTNPLVLKADTSGAIQWLNSTVSSTVNARFSGAAVLGKNLYAAGYVNGGGSASFDDSSLVSATGPYASGSNLLVVRYDLDGTAGSAQTITTAPSSSSYSSIVADSSIGMLYAVGSIAGSSSYTLNSGAVLQGSYSGANGFLSKFW